MFSLLVANIGTTLLYQGRIQGEMQEILIKNGKKIIDIYQVSNSKELIPFMQAFSGTAGTRLQLYNKDAKPLLDEKLEELNVEKSKVETVLAGDIVDNVQEVTYYHHLPVIGVPFHAEGEPYALFLTVERNSVEEEIMNSIHLMYIIILFFGSLLIIVAARYVVNPLVRLTDATKRMAKGNFEIELPTKRKDEIGVLSASFNEMAKELSKMDQMRQEFVASVSHEIQSPLTSISGFSKALKNKKISEEDRLRYLSIIEEESERLSRLSRNLLRLSHLQHELQPITSSSYRLDEQLRNVVIGLEPQWSAKEIEIDIQLEVITIQGDEDQLKQVWTNLLNNSIKFTPVQGKISIEAFLTNNQITVSITDNGIGIPEEERKDIFKPFHKVDKSRDGAVKGNGLGLSIVKQIVDIHNGDIQVEGAAGAGATFTVTLPQQYKKSKGSL
jgi:signal transduction histidine kinase